MNYLVHIGYPKAASTWLQRTLFSGVDPRIKPLRDPLPHTDPRPLKSGGHLFYSPTFSVLNGKLEKYVYPGYFKADAAQQELSRSTDPTGKVTVLSNEVWTGHPFSGGIAYLEYAKRIKAVVPEARILIIVRKQEDSILSAYAHFMTINGGRCDLKTYLTLRKLNQFHMNNPLFYCYHFLIEEYVKLFGKNRVLVLPMEVLRERGGKNFIDPIYHLLNLEPIDLPGMDKRENVRDYRVYVLLSRLRFLNLLARPDPANGNSSLRVPGLHRVLINIGKSLMMRPVVEKALQNDRELIANYFSPFAKFTNLRLQEHVKEDLKKLGYSF